MLSSTSSNVSVEQARMRSRSGQTISVLIVDDHEMLHEIIKNSLADWNIDFHFAMDGLEVVKRLNILYSDCIFLDLVLPNYCGVELAEVIRRHEEERYLSPPAYLIGMTGNMGGREEEVCLASGMNDFITKPFSPDQIQETFRKFLHSRESSD